MTGTTHNTSHDSGFDPHQLPQMYGHPTGLYTLFFAEMWERFSFYGMRALLVLYMMKGFLKYTDGSAYAVYGAYTSLVYMTPFFGGMIADKVIGARRAVILGGVLMALGHLLMSVENAFAFFGALALLILGNGFFKPNISTMVGSLYPPESRNRDSGFTIFYMGVNLGAAMSPLLCGYIGETRGYHWGFSLATFGMMVGLAVFVMPTVITQVLIGLGAVAAALGLLFFKPDNTAALVVNIFIALSLIVSATLAMLALGRGGLPDSAGQKRARADGSTPTGFTSADLIVYIGAVLAIPVFTLLVSDFSLLNEGKPLTLIPAATLEQLQNSENSFVSGVLATFVAAISKPSGLVLAATGLVALSYLVLQMSLISKIARDRLRVVLVLTFFSMVFWAIFEQAGSSVNIFTDRNVNRVYGGQVVSDEMVGQVIDLQPTQLQLGYSNGEDIMTLDKLEAFRQEHSGEGGTDAVMPWTVAEDNVGMRYADRKSELATSSFQAVNPVCILLFGLAFSAMWNFLGERGLDPNPAIKFALGLAQLGLGFGAFWYGTTQADGRGMVAVGWLILGYLLQTTGELCLSPVGLSMVSRLSPRHLVATVMGSWFLATAFSQYLAGIIAMFTSSTPHGHVESGAVPPPIETVTVYGQVFGILALLGIGSGVVCLLLSPLLKSWMHEGVVDDGS